MTNRAEAHRPKNAEEIEATATERSDTALVATETGEYAPEVLRDEDHALLVLDRMISELGQIRDLSTVREKIAAADMIAKFAGVVLKSDRVRHQAAEVRIRYEREGGRVLAQIVKDQGDHGGRPARGRKRSETPYQRALREAPMSESTAARWQEEFLVPDSLVEGYFRKCRDGRVSPTSRGLRGLRRLVAAQPIVSRASTYPRRIDQLERLAFDAAQRWPHKRGEIVATLNRLALEIAGMTPEEPGAPSGSSPSTSVRYEPVCDEPPPDGIEFEHEHFDNDNEDI